jgi:hypothetical protein
MNPDDRDLVSTKEQDFLDQDPPIRGQKYVCLSFLSPEDVLKRKDAFYFEKYLERFSNDLADLWNSMLDIHKENVEFTDSLRSIRNRYEQLFNPDNLTHDYNAYVTNESQPLEDAFYEKENFQTTIRGLKVRGTYDTLREAQVRAQVLKRIDDKFNVYIAEVGCWCPWSPNPSEIENQEFAETELNTLMKKYQENQQHKDEFYNSRKERMKQESRVLPPTGAAATTVVEADDSRGETAELLSKLELLEDPWEQRKNEEAAKSSEAQEPQEPQEIPDLIDENAQT